MTRTNRKLQIAAAACGMLTLSLNPGVASAQTGNMLPPPPASVSTVPPNGDVNPYGVAFVPTISLPGTGVLRTNDILVSNFNNALNLQGTGTTIVRVTSSGQVSQFFQGQAPGLTAALGVLYDGIVIVGSLPTVDGTSNTVKPGGLVVLDRSGNQLGFIQSSAINGPWGMAIADSNNGFASIYISNVLAGTIVRLDVEYSFNGEALRVLATTTVGQGFTHRTDPAALVLGPSGLYYDHVHDILYVASSTDNAVYTLTGVHAAKAPVNSTLLFQDLTHLHGPLDITVAPNGHLLIANSDGSNVDANQPSELVEYTLAGQFVTQFSVDPNNGGAFGLNTFAITPTAIRMAAVDDNQNSLNMWTVILN
ncbi:MAG TPA: hypothetical protein VMB03_17445 [Bryobacteraceae bacterium]|nr:hypothetical protein [Bryobacteraceae bacterium]